MPDNDFEQLGLPLCGLAETGSSFWAGPVMALLEGIDNQLREFEAFQFTCWTEPIFLDPLCCGIITDQSSDLDIDLARIALFLNLLSTLPIKGLAR